MQKIKFWFLLPVFALIVIQSCKKKDGNMSARSRTIQYEISGNYTGSLVASYTTATGGTTNESVSIRPWRKEIIYNSNVSAAIIAISGNGGTAGQQVTVVVKKGGTQISSTTATADNAGSFTRSAPVITF